MSWFWAEFQSVFSWLSVICVNSSSVLVIDSFICRSKKNSKGCWFKFWCLKHLQFLQKIHSVFNNLYFYILNSTNTLRLLILTRIRWSARSAGDRVVLLSLEDLKFSTVHGFFHRSSCSFRWSSGKQCVPTRQALITSIHDIGQRKITVISDKILLSRCMVWFLTCARLKCTHNWSNDFLARVLAKCIWVKQ